MFVVQEFSGSKFYTDDLQRAEEVYLEACQKGKSVELLEGEEGDFKMIKANMKFVARWNDRPCQIGENFRDEDEKIIVMNAPDYDTAVQAFTHIVDDWEEMNRIAGVNPTEGAYDFTVKYADGKNLDMDYCKEYNCEDFCDRNYEPLGERNDEDEDFSPEM